MTRALLSILVVALLASACSSPTVPDMTYYRLPPASETVLAKAPALPIPVDVSVFAADGLYAEQALIYTPGGDGPSLKTYHYQIWIDPPARLLQRRLIGVLRRARGSAAGDRPPAGQCRCLAHFRPDPAL